MLTVCQHNGDRSFIGIDAVNIIPWGNCSAPLLNHGTHSKADTKLRWGNIRRVQGGPNTPTSGRKSVYVPRQFGQHGGAAAEYKSELGTNWICLAWWRVMDRPAVSPCSTVTPVTCRITARLRCTGPDWASSESRALLQHHTTDKVNPNIDTKTLSRFHEILLTDNALKCSPLQRTAT